MKIKQYIIILLAMFLAKNTFATSDCLAASDKLALPSTSIITKDNIEMYAWKFNCNKSRQIALAIGVKNIGESEVSFDWSSITINAESLQGANVIRPGNANINHFTSTSSAYENNITKLAYNGQKSELPPQKYSGSSNTATGKTISFTSGLWYDPSLAGTGFNFIDTPNGLLIYYYGYDKQGAKNWLIGTTLGPQQGNAVVGETYTISLNEPTDGNGGKFSQKPTGDANGTSKWGAMKISFSNCNEAIATLSGTDGKQTFNLVKLIGNEGATCQL